MNRGVFMRTILLIIDGLGVGELDDVKKTHTR